MDRSPGLAGLPVPIRYGISCRLLFPELSVKDYLQFLFQTTAHILQWREKDLEEAASRPWVRLAVALARDSGKFLTVNSLVELALEEGAAGAHLPSSASLAKARRLREQAGRQGFLLGKSTHSLEEARAAEQEGADYIFLGPIFEPLSKEATRPPLGLDLLRCAAESLSIPVFALGGIQKSNLQAVLDTGVAGVAGIGWVRQEMREMLGAEGLPEQEPESPNG